MLCVWKKWNSGLNIFYFVLVHHHYFFSTWNVHYNMDASVNSPGGASNEEKIILFFCSWNAIYVSHRVRLVHHRCFLFLIVIMFYCLWCVCVCDSLYCTLRYYEVPLIFLSCLWCFWVKDFCCNKNLRLLSFLNYILYMYCRVLFYLKMTKQNITHINNFSFFWQLGSIIYRL